MILKVQRVRNINVLTGPKQVSYIHCLIVVWQLLYFCIERITTKDLPGKETSLSVQKQNLFIQMSSLQNLEKIGEGNYAD